MNKGVGVLMFFCIYVNLFMKDYDKYIKLVLLLTCLKFLFLFLIINVYYFLWYKQRFDRGIYYNALDTGD